MEANQSPQTRGSVLINAQYIKDLSFENPKSPSNLIIEEQPSINVSLDVGINPIRDKVFEVILTIQAEGKVKNDSLFIIDLHYAGVFTIETEDQNEREMTLLVYCPSILFPYARRIISDATRDGGFPPLMISPIDFLSLYLQKKGSNNLSDAENDNKTVN